MAECDDIEHWDAQGLENVIGTMDGIHKSHVKLGDTLEGVQANLSSWGGLTAEAWHRYHNKVRVDIDDHGHQAKAVADKLRPLYDEVLGIKSRYRYLKSTIEGNGHFGADGEMHHWKLNNDGTINTGGSTKSADEAFAKQDLEGQMKALLHKADVVDAEIADALKAITTPGGVVADGPHPQQPKEEPKPKPDESINASGQTDPKELPLKPPSGKESNVIPANADPNATEGPRALQVDKNAAPLLAGLSAEQWRERLAHYEPGQPLPDPRTPTGDKSIDALAHAAGQQGTTYAWGGNSDKNGPTMGHKATPQEYPGYTTQELHDDGSWKFDDNTRRGYDCGGLVRYAYEQGAHFDVGQGTNKIDTNPGLHQVEGAGGIKGAQIPQFAKPGDILIFGGQGDFTGAGTTHTGLYVGNGYFINAPGSGMPVQVDGLDSFKRSTTDILRMPGQ